MMRDDQLMNGDEDSLQQEKVGNRFLVFAVQEQSFAIEISYITEIIEVLSITRVPNTPMSVKGVVNLRGLIIPVLDLRLRFDFEPHEYDERTCIIVMENSGVMVGIIVDYVQEILNIESDEIMAPSSGEFSGKSQFIKGIGRANEGVQLILDCDKIIDLNG